MGSMFEWVGGTGLGILNNDPDMWANAQNVGGKVAFNTAKSPYDVWNGQYKAIRPRGATYEHPEGIDAAFKKAKQQSGLLDMIGQE